MGKDEKRYLGSCVSILGTGSDVGKSIVATAICRILKNDGIRVAPFKAQNMSNNSWVTSEGLEMGRAQVVQAQAAGVDPHVDMNPVLLKPSSDTGSQVVLMGKALGNSEASDYFHDTNNLFDHARKALTRLQNAYDVVVMEGAGSCAEVNLRSRDFVNFKIAHAVDAPVILVADIDRGGVFAQIIGTLAVLSERDHKRIKGFIINRFRGDAELFTDGIQYIEEKTGLPVLGLIPYFHHIDIDSEDGLPLDVKIDPKELLEPSRMNIAVLRLPHISNFTDFNPLAREANVRLDYLSRPRLLEGYDIVFLPGSKNVRFDADWLRNTGWAPNLCTYANDGGRIGGICGGYQILGKRILDPHGVEGTPGETKGLGLLDVDTTLEKEKTLTRIRGHWKENGEALDAYEIHMGRTTGEDAQRPPVGIINRNDLPCEDRDGAQTADGRIWGTYLHGLFDSPGFRRAWLEEFGKFAGSIETAKGIQEIDAYREEQYNLLDAHFRKYLDVRQLFDIMGIGERRHG